MRAKATTADHAHRRLIARSAHSPAPSICAPSHVVNMASGMSRSESIQPRSAPHQAASDGGSAKSAVPASSIHRL